MIKKSEFRGELIHKSINKVRQLTEQWNDGLQLGVTNLCERYRKERLGVHLHFRGILSGEGNGSDFCAVFHHLPTDIKINRIPRPAAEINGHLAGIDGTHGDDSMLIGIVNLIEHPQGMLIWGTPLKRLGGLDDCSGSVGDALYHAVRAGFIFVAFNKNRKLPAPFGCLISQDKDDMIQGGTQLVRNFTNEQAELDRWLSAAHVHSKDIQGTCVYVWLQPHRIGVTFKLGGIDCELIDVLFGPFNLCSDSV